MAIEQFKTGENLEKLSNLYRKLVQHSRYLTNLKEQQQVTLLHKLLLIAMEWPELNAAFDKIDKEALN
jgi:hypothetical protein